MASRVAMPGARWLPTTSQERDATSAPLGSRSMHGVEPQALKAAHASASSAKSRRRSREVLTRDNKVQTDGHSGMEPVDSAGTPEAERGTSMSHRGALGSGGSIQRAGVENR